ncbi:MAG TPA: tRNA pseudouridine(55) synthase TruB [Xanthobacteraceae bacterium]|jgi:tRNA pseudouridine55 synthase|nr:tRNA pseudouridine(55) synthase TruB [Xanthobacteraceae bacterium]
MNAPRREKRDVHGWLVLDKPVGTTSTVAVAILKRLTRAKKVGHAGTLDPLASGLLPIAFGEATKTVSYVMDGRKVYRFKVRWGIETDTDDTEGKTIAESAVRPSIAQIEAALPAFTGIIEQTPPKFSAIKVEGERAYDLARAGEEVTLAARPIEIHSLTIAETVDADHTVFEAECGKGTYVRAIARDLGRALGTRGHVCELRRTQVGSFDEKAAITLEEVERLGAASPDALKEALLPVAASLALMPQITLGPDDAQRIRMGQPVFLRGRDAPILEGTVTVSARGGALIALADVEQGALKPKRIFHL